ncbi:MAG: protein translocase subunit SecF, partial [Actinomycetota bacterium]
GGLGLSAVLLLLSIGSLAVRGLNLSLEFKGGVLWEVPSETLTEDDARAVLNEQGLDGGNAKVQILTANDGSRSLEVQVGDQPDTVRQRVQQAFADKAGLKADEVTTQLVSSSWGSSITSKAIRALIIFLVLVAMFIAWRLEWQMALAAIGAMLHDVLLSVGLYSLFGFTVTPATVVAFLTILGFSLYDTIVVFDKVQENQQRYAGFRVPYADILNVSMNQVLMRSLNTSLAAVLPVLSLLVLGAGIMGATTLREFALALLVGLITGSYSSIFVASPLVAIIKETEPRFKPLRNRHATGAELERLVLGGSPSARREGARQRTQTA